MIHVEGSKPSHCVRFGTMTVAVIMLAALVGCPSQQAPHMSLGKTVINFGGEATTQSFHILNSGTGSLSWSVVEGVSVMDNGNRIWDVQDVPWLTVTPTAGTTTTETDRVEIRIDRAGLSAGVHDYAGVRISWQEGRDKESKSRWIPVIVDVEATFAVAPQALALPDGTNQVEFTMSNSAEAALDYVIYYLADPGDTDDPAEAWPPWLSIDAGEAGFGSTGTLPPNGSTVGTLSVDRGLLEEGIESFGLLIVSDGGSAVVTVQFTQQATAVLAADPAVVDIYGPEDTAEFRVVNNGEESIAWSIAARNLAESGGEVPILLEPQVATTLPGESTEVTVSINAEMVQQLIYGSEAYALYISWSGAPIEVPLIVEKYGLPQLVASDPPLEDATPVVRRVTTLDFGREAFEYTFYVVNIGDPRADVTFEISYEGQDENNSLIADIQPLRGRTLGQSNVFWDSSISDWRHAVPVSVTIDRNNLLQDVEYRRISIVALGADYEQELSQVEPVELDVRVERPPIQFEGAANRSRPPFMTRFVFLLRDTLGKAIDTLNPVIFQELQTAFQINVDGRPLPSSETNSFVTSAENLRYNLVCLLDYTGSMYETARQFYPNSAAPLRRLYAGPDDDMTDIGAVGSFISNFEGSMNIALMGYHDRQQRNRVIQSFSANSDSLVEALKSFELDPAAHGASDIFDALIDACSFLAEQDLDATPFVEDADVRAIVFITDGYDNSSMATDTDVVSVAQALRVRLYPIAFGESVNAAPLIKMASETGGHFYRARRISDPDAQDLLDLLKQDQSTFDPEAPGQVAAELQRQIVLTYVSLPQAESDYRIDVFFRGDSGSTEGDVVLENNSAVGDVRAGQISLATNGLTFDAEGDPEPVEVTVRSEYTPRNVSRFRFRFFTDPWVPITIDDVEVVGILNDEEPWRIIDEGSNVFTILTQENAPLPYGAFGDLVRITLDDFSRPFDFQCRVDNQIYATFDEKFFQYPTGPLGVKVDVLEYASVGLDEVILVTDDFDINAEFAWDSDEDGVRDFDDPDRFLETIPASFVLEKSLNFKVISPIDSTETQKSITVRNTYLDIMEQWAVVRQPDWIESVSPAAGTDVLPQEQQIAVVSVNYAGLSNGFYQDEIEIQSDFGTVVLPVTLTLQVVK